MMWSENDQTEHFILLKADTSIGKDFPLFEELRRMGKLCDVILKVEDVKIQVHRVVLAATIPYFHAMFVHGMAEGQKEEVIIKGVESNALQSLIKFVYTGEVRIDPQNVQNLMMGASFIQLVTVQDACEKFMITELKPENAIDLRHFAHAFNSKKLLDLTEHFIEKFFSAVSETEDFLSLSADNFLDLIGRDGLNVASEDVLFKICMNWVKYNKPERSTLLLKVLDLIRFPLISYKFLVETMKLEDLILSSPECRRFIDKKEEDFLRNFEDRHKILADIRLRWGYYEKVYLIAMTSEQTFTVEMYDLHTKQWQMWDILPRQRGTNCNSGKVTYMNENFFITTYDNNADKSYFDVYDIKAKRTYQLKNFVSRRGSVAVCGLGDRIYLWSCREDNNWARSAKLNMFQNLEFYSLKTGIWTSVAQMPVGLYNVNIETLDGKIYVLGSMDLHRLNSRKVYRYDPAENLWTEIEPMGSTVTLDILTHSMTALGGKLYIVHGYFKNFDVCNTTDVYDPKTNTWECLVHMNFKHIHLVSVGVNEELWVIEGVAKGSAQPIEIYNPSRKTWHYGPPLFKMAAHIGVGTIKWD